MQSHFSLQPVLDYRHTLVEALEVELGQTMKLREQKQAVYVSLVNHRREVMDQLYQRQNGELDVSLLSQLRLNLRYLEEQIVRQQTLLRELDALLLVRRQAVVKARQDEEVLATLRRKETERYEAELARREGNLQDDIYIAQAFRRSMQVQH